MLKIDLPHVFLIDMCSNHIMFYVFRLYTMCITHGLLAMLIAIAMSCSQMKIELKNAA